MSTQNTKVLFDPIQIEDCVWGIGNAFNKLYEDPSIETNVVFCPILTGVVPFFADLIKYIEMEPYVEYIGASSYDGTQQQPIKTYKMPDPKLIEGRIIWLFDDIADSGKTLQHLKDTLLSDAYKAAEVKTCVLLKKSTCTFLVDIFGFLLENDDWIHGYGLDAPNGRGRTSPALYATTF